MKLTTNKPENATEIKVSAIRTDGGTQPRGELNQDRIGQMAGLLDDGHSVPPVVVFYDGESYWLADGFHRLAAHQCASLTRISCIVHQGTLEDARWYSYAANKEHDSAGLPRSNADKARAVEAALAHPRSAKLSNVQIAQHCGVNEKMVRTRRPSTSAEPKSREGKDGRTINVSAIGKTRPATPSPAEPEFKEGIIGRIEPAPEIVYEEGIVGDEPEQVPVVKDSLTVEPAPAEPPSPAEADRLSVLKRTMKADEVKDQVGRPITDEALLAVFAQRPAFGSLAHQVSALKARFEELANGIGGTVAFSRIKGFNAAIDTARSALRFSIPHAVCPYCAGIKCQRCGQQGWMAEDVWRLVPSEERGMP